MSYLTKDAIILEIGQFYTKVGFGHENVPMKLIRTQDYFIYENIEIGEKYEKFSKRVLSYSNKDKRMNELDDFFHHIFYNVLTLDPESKRIFVCLNLLTSRVLLDMIMEILFKRYNAESIIFIPNNILPLYITGSFSGLVIDSGFLDTHVLPVYNLNYNN